MSETSTVLQYAGPAGQWSWAVALGATETTPIALTPGEAYQCADLAFAEYLLRELPDYWQPWTPTGAAAVKE